MDLIKTKRGKYTVSDVDKRKIKELLEGRCFNISAVSRFIFGKRDTLTLFLKRKDYTITREQFKKLKMFFSHVWVDRDEIEILDKLVGNCRQTRILMNQLSNLQMEDVYEDGDE